MILIDTHAHVYLDEFERDRDAVLARARAAGIDRILLPAIDISTHAAMLQLEEEQPGYCLSMMGVHPCSVKENYEDELGIAETYLAKQKFIAVGETGLDFYWDLTFTQQQYDAFHRQAEWALHYDIPLVIHSRNATDECIEVVRQHQNGKLKGVFHCFSGNQEQVQQVVDLGFYLGIGGVLTFKNSGLDKAITGIDPKHMILETDAPYLAPVPFRGKRNECSYLPHVVQKLAGIAGKSEQEIAAITTANAQQLFGI